MIATLFAAVAAMTIPASAQCEPRWLTGGSIPGVDGEVHALIEWDRDGAGATPPVIVAGGRFRVAGSVLANNVAIWNGRTWEALGLGTDPTVRALAIDGDNHVIAAGDFLNAGGFPAARIAKWDGQSWSTLGTGLDDTVTDAETLANGDVVVCGSFDHAGGSPADTVARWDGVQWWPMAGGVAVNLRDLDLMPNGDLLGTGGSSPARWNGVEWSAIGSSMFSSSVTASLALSDGRILACTGPIPSQVFLWDGSTWAPIASGPTSAIETLAELPDGRIVLAGAFYWYQTGPVGYLMQWDGSTMNPLAGGFDARVRTLAVTASGRLVAGGNFRTGDALGNDRSGVASVAALADGRWTPLGSGTNAPIGDLELRPDGTVLAVGGFLQIEGDPAESIALWNGVEWVPYAHGIVGSLSRALEMPDGTLYVAGSIQQAGGAPATAFAHWNGSAWSSPGMGLGHSQTPSVNSLNLLPDGSVLVTGRFTSAGGIPSASVARWDGGSWSGYGPGIPFNPTGTGVTDAMVLPDGSIMAVGAFTTQFGAAANAVAIWSGSAWTSAGWLGANRHGILLDSTGAALVGGPLSTALNPPANLARWDGTTWHSHATAVNANIHPRLFSQNGALVVTGDFTQLGSTQASRIAIWDGLAWRALVGGGVVGWVDTNTIFVTDVIALPSGELAISGSFSIAGGQPSGYFARYTFTNIPWVALHPQPFTTTPGSTITLSSTPATGYDNLTFQWQRESAPGSNQWTNLADGPGGASPGGGTVMNSSGLINGGQEILLSISNLALSDAGAYRCIISNPCGQDESDPATLTITNPCPPDLTTTAIPGSPGYGLPNGTLNNDDFFFFLAAFASGNLAVADMTTTAVPGSPGYGVPNGVINNDEFFYYLSIFAAGC